MADMERPVVDTEYNASEIQVLEGLEAVRKRPGMYIGSTSASGLHHLVYEIVDNSIDEALAGYCTDITVTINPGDTITVTDNGRGIPVDVQAQTGRPALEVVFTVLHAGGKFGGGGYKVSGGLHGVGASVVNALSEWLTVQVHKDGKIYEMKFSRGNITQEMQVIGDTDHTGTTVTFKPDPEMFDTLEYDYETLHTRMREQAFLNAGLRITISDARPGREQSEAMCYEGGIREFVTYINRNKTPLHEEVIYLSGAKGDSTAEIAMQYNDGYNETLVSFANDIHTPEGGMHETGFKAALTRVLNAYGIKYGMIKEGDKISGEDAREGITAVISVKLTEAQFEGQTKAKLGNSEMRTLVDSVVFDRLSQFLEENPAVGRMIIESLDKYGYLREHTEDMLRASHASPAAFARALAAVQALEPCGVAARSLGECLALQLRARTAPEPLALEIVTGHLEEMAAGTLRLPGHAAEEIEAACRLIRSLNPRPGAAFDQDVIHYIVPDVRIARGESGRLCASLINQPAPPAIAPQYMEYLKAEDEPQRQYVRDNLMQARSFLFALKERAETLLAIASLAVAVQEEYLTAREPGALRPLTMTAAARTLPFHSKPHGERKICGV